jgi:hypothetical protein
VRVRDHVAVSTAGAALLQPVLGPAVLGAWVASIVIDVDHYLWFCVTQHSTNPVAAMRFFSEPEAPQHRATRIFHSPLVLSAVCVLGVRQRKFLPAAMGMALHIAADAYHEARLDAAGTAALQRDGFTCQSCGAKGRVTAHVQRQPRLLPSYRVDNLVTLCPDCHRAAHGHQAPSLRRSAG